MNQPASGRAAFEARFRRLAARGPRGAGTDAERAAARHLADELVGLGLQAALDPFAGSRSMGARLLGPTLLAAVGTALSDHSGVAAAALATVSLAVLVTEQMGVHAWFTRLLAPAASANEVAVVPALGPPRRRVVLCAHYDTQRAGLIWNPLTTTLVAPIQARLPGPMKTILFPVVLAMVVQLAVGVLAAADVFAPPMWVTATLLGVYAVAGLLLGD